MSATGVGAREIVQAWGRILAGYRPNLSIEITKECPLRCPGCYAYGDEHLGGDVTLRGLSDYKGDELVARFMALIDRHNPLHVSIVGGEPLVSYRELERDPAAARRARHSHAARHERGAPDSQRMGGLHRLQVVVSIDGLQPEHDVRRTPATYDRILKHIEGHQITVHCTVTRQQVRRDGLSARSSCDSGRPTRDTRLIWISLYTPQIGELSTERLTEADRARVIADLRRLRPQYSEAADARRHAQGLRQAAESPDDCIFAQTTECFSSDLERRITPCQFGGNPDCTNCGCIASAGLEAIGRHRLRGGIPVGRIFYASLAIGRTIGKIRRTA